MPNRTVDDVVDRAFGRLDFVDARYPSARAFMYERIGFRQRQLLAGAAKQNPERYGACATVTLSSGLIDFTDIVAPTVALELIQRIEIADKGTSPYAVGDEVHIVSADDQNAAMAPRCLIRDSVLIQVGTDLALVTTLKVYYARIPELVPATSDGTTVVEFTAPWDTLLELDLVKWLLQKATRIDAAERAQALAGFGTEEAELLTAYGAHVTEYTPIVSRFLPPKSLSLHRLG